MNFYRNTLCRSYSNGMTVYVLPRPGGTAMVECYIKTGSIHEENDLGCGLSHFLEHMLFQGCDGYPGTAAADTLQYAGCSVNAYTSYDRTVYHSSGPGNKVPLMLKVLASMIRSPELPEKRFLAERDVILREYDRTQDDPGRRLQEELFRLMFPGHPLRIPVIGRREMISEVTASMAAAYHSRRYTPGRCFWVVTGSVNSSEVFDTLDDLLGSWKESNLSEIQLPSPVEPQYAERSSEFIFPDTVSRLTVGIKLDRNMTVRMPVFDILTGLLGMGSGSRLPRKFELDSQLALGLRSCCYSLPGCGFAGFSAVSVPGKLQKLERELKKELQKVSAGDISDAEIIREKNQQFAEHLRQMEELEHISSIIGSGVMSGSPEIGDLYQEQMENTTPDQVRQAAAELLQSNKFCTVRQLTKSKISKPQRASESGENIQAVKNSSKVPLLLIPDHSIPLVHFSLVLPGGTIFEKPGKSGSAKLTANLIGAGTLHRSEDKLLTLLDKYGAYLSVNCGNNTLGIELNAPRKYFSSAIKILAEILAEPMFGEREFERERARLLESLASRKTAALESAFDEVRKQLLGDHPYANGMSGTVKDLCRINTGDIHYFYNNALCIKRSAAGFSGDLTVEDAQKWSSILFDDLPWKNTEPEFPLQPVYPESCKTASIALEREQTAVTVAVPGQKFSNIRHHQIFTLLSKAENGLASNLFKTVREERALAYSVGMDMAGGFHPGWFTFYAQTRHDQAQETVKLLLQEIKRLADEGLKKEEFERAKERALYQILRTKSSNSGRLTSSVLEMFYDPETVPDERREQDFLEKLTAGQANKVITDAFAAGARAIVYAGKLPDGLS